MVKSCDLGRTRVRVQSNDEAVSSGGSHPDRVVLPPPRFEQAQPRIRRRRCCDCVVSTTIVAEAKVKSTVERVISEHKKEVF